MKKFLYQLSIDVENDHVSPFVDSLEPYLDSVSWTIKEDSPIVSVLGLSADKLEKNNIELVVSYTAKAIGIVKPKIKLIKIPERNWVLDNIKNFPPIEIGRFFIHSSEYKRTAPKELFDLCIPAAEAFGTGDHGSTKGCLIALNKMDYAFKSKLINSALDMGCGSGILSIAIAKRWRVPVISSDIDPIATDVCRRNIRINGVKNYVKCLYGSGYRHRKIKKHKFDLIVSNILSRPLMILAKDVGRHLCPGGWAILSGLLSDDVNKILITHHWHGLRLVDRIKIDNWQTLILKKPIGKK